VEELRYEQERLRWQLNQAAHLGAPSLPTQTPVTPTPTPASSYCSHSASDRYVVAKHTAIYPTTEDVRLTAALYNNILTRLYLLWFAAEIIVIRSL